MKLALGNVREHCLLKHCLIESCTYARCTLWCKLPQTKTRRTCRHHHHYHHRHHHHHLPTLLKWFRGPCFFETSLQSACYEILVGVQNQLSRHRPFAQVHRLAPWSFFAKRVLQTLQTLRFPFFLPVFAATTKTSCALIPDVDVHSRSCMTGSFSLAAVRGIFCAVHMAGTPVHPNSFHSHRTQTVRNMLFDGM